MMRTTIAMQWLAALVCLAGAAQTTACSSGQEATNTGVVVDSGVTPTDTSVDTGPTCATTETVCGTTCKDLSSDRQNCGECGKTCDKGTACVSGKCTVECPAGSTMCDDKCVVTATDNANCGACGTKCPMGEVCSAGKCALTCGAPLTECGGTASDAGTDDGGMTDGGTSARYCASLKTDRLNCGACGVTCKAGEICKDGTCAVSCGTGLTDCSGTCRDLTTDVNNCGACGTACAAGQVCTAGACVTSCGTGLTNCSGTCRDLTTDTNNCGACGTACTAGQVCTAGACVTSCGTGLTNCSGTCTNTAFDPSNCGACGTACATGESCVAGACKLVCAAGETNCSGVCKKTSEDLNNCGACGNICPTRPNAVSTCTTGGCGFTCNTGFADCDGLASNGCEVNLLTDPTHCGTCSTSCGSGGTCTAGTCGPRCYSGGARVLVYGPSASANSISWFPTGTTVTNASATQWNSMTTADFGNYDIIWIDGGQCSGSMTSLYGTAEASIAAWGPAVRGRIALMAGDPDLHGGTAATQFTQNTINWLKTMGRNTDGGRTSLYFSWGCTMVTSPYSAGAAASPEKFSSVLGAGITGNATNYCAAFTTTAGSTHPMLAGITSYWGCPSHGAFSTLPTGYTSLALGAASTGPAVIASRESPIACIP